MARRIRLSLAECYGDEYAVAMQLLGSLREELKQRYPHPGDRKVIFERMVYSGLLEMIQAGDANAIEEWIERCIEEGPGYASPGEHASALANALDGGASSGGRAT